MAGNNTKKEICNQSDHWVFSEQCEHSHKILNVYCIQHLDFINKQWQKT